VNSYEVGRKEHFNNRVRLAYSVYYIRWNNIQQLIVPPGLPDLLHRQYRASGC